MEQAQQDILDGILVVDLTRVLGGPFCTQILGDFGADVIKIEPPQGDETRGWGPPFVNGAAAYFEGVNRNKRGLSLDLGSAEGRDALLRLLEGADVLVHNFKPGAMERWGLGNDMLEALYPALVICWVTGFGEDGPHGGQPGYDAVAQGLTGLMSVNGDSGGPPLRLGVPVVDIMTGMNAALGIVMALFERVRSGRGQRIENALFDNGLSILHPHLANHLANGSVPARTGSAHPNIAPYDIFRAGDGNIFLAVGNDRQFARLCDELGLADLADSSDYATNADRSGNRVTLKSRLEAAMTTRGVSELAERLTARGVPCGPILNVAEAVAQQQTRTREMIVEIEGGYRGTASPIKLSRTPARYRRRPPALDEHREEVLNALDAPARNRKKAD